MALWQVWQGMQLALLQLIKCTTTFKGDWFFLGPQTKNWTTFMFQFTNKTTHTWRTPSRGDSWIDLHIELLGSQKTNETPDTTKTLIPVRLCGVPVTFSERSARSYSWHHGTVWPSEVVLISRWRVPASYTLRCLNGYGGTVVDDWGGSWHFRYQKWRFSPI